MKNFFKGISFSSIFAGALAAKIGIAGSVIGVAAGSIVSAVATQVYKNVLKASGEKLQNAVPFVANDKDGTDGAGKSGDDATTVIAPAESEGEQTKTLSAEESDETTVMTSVDGDTTAAMPATSGRVISSAQAGGRESNILPDNAGGSIQHAGRRASFDAWLHGKRAPIVIAIVSALIGVAVSAGTDTVVRDMVNSKQTPSDDNAGDSTYGSGNNGTQDNMQNQSGTTDTDKDSTTNSDRNNGKDTGKKTDSTTGVTGTSTDGSDSSTNTGDDSNKTDSSTDSTTPSDGSTSGTNNSGQSGAGTTTTPNGSTSTNQNPTPNGSNPNGTSSGTSGNGTDTSK